MPDAEIMGAPDLLSGGTAATGVTETRIPSPTRTTVVLRTESVSEIRKRVRELSTSVDAVHQRAYIEEWQVLTQARAASGGITLLNELADLGFSWRDIARLAGVSVPAIQKWRKGANLSPDNRHKLARLLAGCDFISSHLFIEDIGQWFEMPIVDTSPITPIDLWAAGQEILVFEYATRYLAPEETLSRYDSSWRDKYRTSVETFIGDDSYPGLRVRK